jgi:hypothetical protein
MVLAPLLIGSLPLSSGWIGFLAGSEKGVTVEMKDSSRPGIEAE